MLRAFKAAYSTFEATDHILQAVSLQLLTSKPINESQGDREPRGLQASLKVQKLGQAVEIALKPNAFRGCGQRIDKRFAIMALAQSRQIRPQAGGVERTAEQGLVGGG